MNGKDIHGRSPATSSSSSSKTNTTHSAVGAGKYASGSSSSSSKSKVAIITKAGVRVEGVTSTAEAERVAAKRANAPSAAYRAREAMTKAESEQYDIERKKGRTETEALKIVQSRKIQEAEKVVAEYEKKVGNLSISQKEKLMVEQLKGVERRATTAQAEKEILKQLNRIQSENKEHQRLAAIARSRGTNIIYDPGKGRGYGSRDVKIITKEGGVVTPSAIQKVEKTVSSDPAKKDTYTLYQRGKKPVEVDYYKPSKVDPLVKIREATKDIKPLTVGGIQVTPTIERKGRELAGAIKRGSAEIYKGIAGLEKEVPGKEIVTDVSILGVPTKKPLIKFEGAKTVGRTIQQIDDGVANFIEMGAMLPKGIEVIARKPSIIPEAFKAGIEMATIGTVEAARSNPTQFIADMAAMELIMAGGVRGVRGIKERIPSIAEASKPRAKLLKIEDVPITQAEKYVKVKDVPLTSETKGLVKTGQIEKYTGKGTKTAEGNVINRDVYIGNKKGSSADLYVKLTDAEYKALMKQANIKETFVKANGKSANTIEVLGKRPGSTIQQQTKLTGQDIKLIGEQAKTKKLKTYLVEKKINLDPVELSAKIIPERDMIPKYTDVYEGELGGYVSGKIVKVPMRRKQVLYATADPITATLKMTEDLVNRFRTEEVFRPTLERREISKIYDFGLPRQRETLKAERARRVRLEYKTPEALFKEADLRSFIGASILAGIGEIPTEEPKKKPEYKPIAKKKIVSEIKKTPRKTRKEKRKVKVFPVPKPAPKPLPKPKSIQQPKAKTEEEVYLRMVTPDILKPKKKIKLPKMKFEEKPTRKRIPKKEVRYSPTTINNYIITAKEFFG